MSAAGFFLRLSIVILAALLPFRAVAVNVTLGWQPSASPDVTGYMVRYGLESGHYIYKVPVGTNTSAYITGLVEGMTYYFVVTSFSSAGVESDPSNEVGYTVPGVAAPGQPWIQMDPATGLMILKWNGSASPYVAGYNVYFGTSSGSHPQLVFSGDAIEFALSNLSLTTNGYFVVTAFDYFGQQSTNTLETVSPAPDANGVLPKPVLALRRTPVTGLPNVFSVTATGAIPPAWVLEASSDLRTWKSVTTGSNAAVRVNVIVSPGPKQFFRLNSPFLNVQIKAQRPINAFPNAFFFGTLADAPPTWTVQTSADLKNWNDLCSGEGNDVKVAVVPSKASALFFRLKNQ